MYITNGSNKYRLTVFFVRNPISVEEKCNVVKMLI